MKSFFGSCLGFLKRNVYYVLLAVSILLIGAMITYAALSNSTNTPPVIEEPGPGDPGGNDPDPVDTEPVVFIMPLDDFTVGMQFSMTELVFNPTLKRFRVHSGLDLKTEQGADVYAVYDGVVESVESAGVDGTVITLKHNDELTTVYKSLESDPPVSAGDRIKKGDVIGKAGTSISSILEGAHVHIEVIYQGEYADPAEYLPFENK